MKTLLQNCEIATTSTRSHSRDARAIFFVAASLLASCSTVSCAEEAAPSLAAAIANATSPSSSTATVVSPRAINVLLVPLDDLAAAPDIEKTSLVPTSGASGNSGGGSTTENVSPSVSVGAAERAAAPLRRALMKLGYNDVLSAAPTSSVLRRAVEEKLLPLSVLDNLSDAMRLVSSATISDDASVTSSTQSDSLDAATPGEMPTIETSTAETPTVETTVESTPVENSAVTPPSSEPLLSEPPLASPSLESSGSISTSVLRSASVSDASLEFSAARRKAIAAASRLGRLLGYRAVVAFSVVNDNANSRVVFLLVDSLRENGAVMVPTVAAANGRAFSLAAAERGSSLLGGRLGTWDAFSVSEKSNLADDGIARARALLSSGDAKKARVEINAALALDPKRTDVLELLGDILLKSGDFNGAIATYRRIIDAADASDKGAAWAKIAQAYVAAQNWPETVRAGAAALEQKADSSDLRLAMAEAQIGRAVLFLEAGRGESATFALEDAEKHLVRAASLAPSDPRVMRLQVQQLTLQNRTREALSLLDRIAAQYLDDGELQANYATTLLMRSGREADAFRAWSRAWSLLSDNGASPANEKLNKALPSPDRLRFRRLNEGFDLSIGEAAKNLYKLTEQVLEGTVAREDAIALARAPLNLVVSSGSVLKAMNVPDGRMRADYLARLDAADKMAQAVAAYSLFLENGNQNFRDSGIELHKSAVAQINALRAAQ